MEVAVSVLGLVGWVGMVPKLGELQWKFPVTGSRYGTVQRK